MHDVGLCCYAAKASDSDVARMPWKGTRSTHPSRRWACNFFFWIKWAIVKVPEAGGQVQIKYRFWQCLGDHTIISSWLFPHGFSVDVVVGVTGSPTCWGPNVWQWQW